MEEKYTVEFSEKDKILQYILEGFGIIALGIMAFLVFFDHDLFSILLFYGLLIVAVFFLIHLILSIVQDIQGKNYRIAVDGETISILEGKKKVNYQFKDIQEVAYSPHPKVGPSDQSFCLCFSKYEYYMIDTDMINWDKLYQKLESMNLMTKNVKGHYEPVRKNKKSRAE